MRPSVFLAALMLATPLFVLAGCGGGDSSSTTAATTPLKLDITWPARSRDVPVSGDSRTSPTPTPSPTTITAPASALSAVVSLQQGSFPAIDRGTDLASYVQSYISPLKVRPGPNILTVTFYAGKAGAGVIVGTASKTVNISDTGEAGGGSVLVVGKVQRIAITSPARITVGQNADLVLSATDGNGAAVAVSAGSATFTLLSGSEAATLTPDGKLTAKAAGIARVSASLDGKTSDPFEIEVRAPGTATGVIAAGQSVKIGENKALEFSFTDADGSPVSYDPAQLIFEVTSGSDTGSVTSAGRITGAKLGLLKLKAKIPGLESAETTVRVVPTGNITVTIPVLQNLAVAETKTVAIAVKDTSGADVPVGTDGASFSVTRGSAALTITTAGAATGVATGYGVVQVTVAGTSVSQAVFVGSIVTNSSGLKYIEKLVGTGVSPNNGQTVTVNYTGSLLNGNIFDSSLNPGRTPFSFQRGTKSVIDGFDEGVASMKVGGKRLLIIPSNLGYGATGSGATIAPDSTLIFDLELLEITG